jgi:cytoskeletal protein RodZ
MTWSGFFKSLSIFLITVALITVGSYFGFQYVLTQFTALPPKPTFPNDKPSPVAEKTSPIPNATTPPTPQADVTASPTPTPNPTPTTEPSPTEDTYQARIKLDNGLNVRESPNADAGRVGGVDFDQVVTVLEESQDKEWQRIRVETTGVEGWIKAGYVDRLDAQNISQ